MIQREEHSEKFRGVSFRIYTYIYKCVCLFLVRVWYLVIFCCFLVFFSFLYMFGRYLLIFNDL